MEHSDNKIKEYSAIEAGIAKMAVHYPSPPSCSTDKGLKLCKKQYREIRSVEINLEAIRKEHGAAARKHLDLVNSEAKRIDTQIKLISAPYKNAFENRDLEIKEAENLRIADIESRISDLQDFVASANEEDSEGVMGIIEAINMIDCSESFDEFTQKALRMKSEVLAQLGPLLQQKIESEATERELLVAEEARKALEAKQIIDDLINKIKMTPVTLIGKPSADIAAQIELTVNRVISNESFGDRCNEAELATSDALLQLNTMKDQADRLEADKLRKEEEPKAQDEQERITKLIGRIAAIPDALSGKPSEKIASELSAIRLCEFTEKTYGHRAGEAEAARLSTISQLEEMESQTKLLEEERAQQEEQKPAVTESVKAKCDGNHSGPRCSDPECWIDDELSTPAEEAIKTVTRKEVTKLPPGSNKIYDLITPWGNKHSIGSDALNDLVSILNQYDITAKKAAA